MEWSGSIPPRLLTVGSHSLLQIVLWLTQDYSEWFQGFLGHAAIRLFYWGFWLLGLYNVTVALLPLVKNKDELTDIPLTPSQRSLLGLDPSATPPPTPDTKYITPPRYPRSPTPRNISPATRNNSAYSTPVARSPSYGREQSDSPTGSLWGQKSMGRKEYTARRSSYGSPSPLGPGFGGREGSILGAPSTPSPTTGRGASVGLNSKWLYNKGRSSSGMYSGSTLIE